MFFLLQSYFQYAIDDAEQKRIVKSSSAVDLPRDEGKVADGEARTRFDCLTDEADTQASP